MSDKVVIHKIMVTGQKHEVERRVKELEEKGWQRTSEISKISRGELLDYEYVRFGCRMEREWLE